MEPTSTSLDTGGIPGSVGDVLRPPNRSVRQSDHHERDKDIEPPSVAPDYPGRAVIRASRDLFADLTSCHRFAANQFRLLLSSAAYLLVQALRRTALAGT